MLIQCILLQNNCGVSVLDFVPHPEGGSPYICLTRLNQTPSSAIAYGSSAGKKASKWIVLVCHGNPEVKSIVSSPRIAPTETANAIARVQEVADCLGVDCVPRYTEKEFLLQSCYITNIWRLIPEQVKSIVKLHYTCPFLYSNK
uniref:Uncharacterized protein n=1 Tax=Lactuca sativa TaxID=4236 RepID=A0A9R1XC71_LACSA|nr:hypothetical protein LSAT_V11C400201770 [Lactuca sativa]